MARRFTVARALAVLFTCMAGAIGPASAEAKQPGCAHVSVVPSAETLSRAHDAVMCLINKERARRRAAALRSSAPLTRAASGHSRDMVALQYFAHEGRDGTTPRQRVLRSGYFRGRAGGMVEEALACGLGELSTPKALVASLMRSRSHHRVLLSRKLRDVGVGLVLGGPQPGFAGGATLTVDLARR